MAGAELGITVTSTGVSEAVAELDKLAPAAQRAEQATTKLAQTTASTLGSAANQVETFADRINKALNIKSTMNLGRGEDIAAYGQELDRLRQKFNQAHSIMQTYRNDAAEIRQAHSVGAISINEMNAAMDRLRTTTQKQIETERQLKQVRSQTGGGPAGTSAGQARAFQSNLMYQFQDVATTAAMGMSPAMIAMQQGGQIAAPLQAIMSGGGGIKAGITAITGGVMAMMNPVSLATMAVVGLGAAFYQWATGAGEKVKTLDELMKDHAKTVQDLAKAYGFAGASIEKYAQTPIQFTQAAEAKARDDLAKASTQAGRDLFGMGAATGWRSYLPGSQAGSLGAAQRRPGIGADNTEDIARGMEAFADPLRELRQGIKDGNADWDKFAKSVADIGKEKGLSDKANEILTLAKNAADAAEQVKALKDMYKQLNDEANEMQRLQIQQKDARTDTEKVEAAKQLAEYQSRNLEGQAKIDAVTRATREVEADIARQRRDAGQARLDNLEKQVDAEKSVLFVSKMNSTEAADTKQRLAEINEVLMEAKKAGAEAGKAGWEYWQEQIDNINKYHNELLKLKQDEAELERQRTSARNDAQIASMNARTNAEKIAAAGGAAGAGMPEGADKNFAVSEAERLERARQAADAANSTRQQTENLTRLVTKQQEQFELLGKTAGQQAALSQEAELRYALEKDAAEKGIALDQQKLDLIHQQTQAYGELVDKLNQQKLVQDLIFERSLVGMSDQEKTIAQRLRNTGLSTTGPEAAYMRETERQQQLHDFAMETGKDFLTSMSGAITDGGDDMGEKLIQALKGGADRALSKILDKLFDNILNTLLGGGVGGNASGGIGGAIGNALTKGTAASPVAGANTTLSAFLGIGANDNKNVAAMSASLAQSAAAIRSIESGSAAGNYSALGPITKSGDRAYGAYQMMGANIPSWSKQALGYSMTPQQFQGNKDAQDTIFAKIFGGYQNKYGPQGAANTWFTGSPTGGGKDVLGTTSTVYVEKFNKALENVTTTTATKATPAILNLGKSSTDAVSGIGNLGSGAAKLGTAFAQAPAGNAGGGGGIFGWLGKLFGFGGGATAVGGTAAASTAHFVTSPRIYHEGNMFSSSHSRYMDLAAWAGAPRFHNGGMFAANEYPAVLKQGEPVFPNVAAAAAFGGSKTIVNVHNYAGADVKTKTTEDDKGGMTLDVMVDKLVASKIDTRGTASNSAIRSKFGVSERLKMR